MFSGMESWRTENQSLTDNIGIKKLNEGKETSDKEWQGAKKDLADINWSNGNAASVDEESNKELHRTRQKLQLYEANLKLVQKENEAFKKDLQAIEKKLRTMRSEWKTDGFEENLVKDQASGLRPSFKIFCHLNGVRNQLQISRENCRKLANEVRIYKEKLVIRDDELTKTKQLMELKGHAEYADLLSKTEKELKKCKDEKSNFETECQRSKDRILEVESRVRELEQAGRGRWSSGQFKGGIVEAAANIQVPTSGLKLDESQIHLKNQDLEAELLMASQKLANTESDLWRSQSQVDDLTAQLKIALQKIAAFEWNSDETALDEPARNKCNNQLQSIKRQVHDLWFALQRKENENSKLETRLKETREEMHKMEIQLNLCHKQRSQLRDEMQKERQEFSMLEDEHKTLQKNISENIIIESFYKQELESKEYFIAELEANAASAELKYHELSEEKVKIEYLLEKYKTEYKEIENDLMQTHTDMADMQVELNVAEKEKEKLNTELKTTCKTISDLKLRCQLAVGAVKERGYDLSLTTKRLERIEAELEVASKVKSTLELQIYERKSNARKREDEDSAMSRHIEEYQRTHEELRELVSEKELVIDRLKDQISTLETDIQTLTMDVSYPHKSLNATNEEESKRVALKLKGSEEEVVRHRHKNVFKEMEKFEIDLSVAPKRAEALKSSLRENLDKENDLVKALPEEHSKFLYDDTHAASNRSNICSLEFQGEVYTKGSDELHELHDRINELDSNWTQGKKGNEKLNIEEAAASKQYDRLTDMYGNLVDGIKDYRAQAEEKDFSNDMQLQKVLMERDVLSSEVQRLNKRLTILNENYEKTQKERKDLERDLKIMQQRLLILEAGEKSIDTITAALQKELDESKLKIIDVSTMYEAAKSERDALRAELVNLPTTPKFSLKHETKPIMLTTFHDGPFTQKERAYELSPKKEMFETQARAALLGRKLKIARERLEDLKSAPLHGESGAENTETFQS